MRRFSSLSISFAFTALAAFGLACADSTGPLRDDGTDIEIVPGGDSSAQTASDTGPSLVECPTQSSQTASGILSPLGSTVSLGGTSITVPLGAVSVPVPVTLTLPASRYMEVEIHVAGLELERFEFLLPVRVTIDYSRCTRSDILKDPLEVWYIDGNTDALLEQMDVVSDNKLLKRITFSSTHLSSYAIAH